MIKLMVVEYFIGCGCYSGQLVPAIGVRFEKKTVCAASERWLSNLCSET